jgi:hypothetical protein
MAIKEKTIKTMEKNQAAAIKYHIIYDLNRGTFSLKVPFCLLYYAVIKKNKGFMPYKVGKKTKTKGWPILKHEHGKWRVIAHSHSKANAQASIRARHMSAHRKP